MKQYLNITNYKSKIYVREMDENGNEIFKKENFNPYLYTSCTKENATHKDFYGGPVRKKTFDSVYDMKNFIKEQKEISGQNIWGSTDPISQYIYKTYTDTPNLTNIRISYLDIEVLASEILPDGSIEDFGFPDAKEALYPVNAIGQYDSILKKYIIFTTAQGWSKEKSQLPYKDNVVCINCSSEKELFRKWLVFYKKYTPAIITGWNIKTFDIPYLINRMKNIFSNDEYLELSPWKVINERETKGKFGDYELTYSILGVSVIDYIELYKKYRHKNRRKMTLDYVSQCELKNRHKLHFKGSYGDLYFKDPVLFVDYNAQDIDCVVGFEEKLQFIRLITYLSYYSGINFEDNFSPIKIWETLIYRNCDSDGIAIPVRKKMPIKEEFEGAYVVEPIPGRKKLIVSCDAASEYPNAIISWNISPDTIVKGERREKILSELSDSLKERGNDELLSLLKTQSAIIDYYVLNRIDDSFTDVLRSNNVGMSPNWQFYDNTKDGIITVLSKRLFAERKQDKKTSFEYKHLAQDVKKEIEKRGIDLNKYPSYEHICHKDKDLSTLSEKELVTHYKECLHLAEIFDIFQLTKKILLELGTYCSNAVMNLW